MRDYYIVLNLNLSACICNILFHLDGPNLNRSRTGPKSGKISDVTKRLDVSNKQFKTVADTRGGAKGGASPPPNNIN